MAVNNLRLLVLLVVEMTSLYSPFGAGSLSHPRSVTVSPFNCDVSIDLQSILSPLNVRSLVRLFSRLNRYTQHDLSTSFVVDVRL